MIFIKNEAICFGIGSDPFGLNHRRWSQDPGCDLRSYFSFPLLFFLNSTKIPPQTLKSALSHIIYPFVLLN